MFFDILQRECDNAGIAMSALLDATGLSRGNITRWKNGLNPKAATKMKLADALKIPHGILLENQEKSATKSDELDVKSAIIRLEAALSADCAMFDGKRLTDEDKLKAYGGIQFLKAQLAARAANEKDKKSR